MDDGFELIGTHAGDVFGNMGMEGCLEKSQRMNKRFQQ